MWATEYGERFKRHYFDISDVCYVIEKRLECVTFFANGEQISLSWIDMKSALKILVQVYSHDIEDAIYINPQAISSYKEKGHYVNANFNNGLKLSKLSRIQFENYVIPQMNEEIGKEL